MPPASRRNLPTWCGPRRPAGSARKPAWTLLSFASRRWGTAPAARTRKPARTLRLPHFLTPSPSTCLRCVWTWITTNCASASILCWRRPRWPSVWRRSQRCSLPIRDFSSTFIIGAGRETATVHVADRQAAAAPDPYPRGGSAMIAHLRGKLLSKHPNQAVVEAAGVGYEVNITIPTFSALPAAGTEVALFVHTHVREDALALFGFLKANEKQLFEKLLGVSGIGP